MCAQPKLRMPTSMTGSLVASGGLCIAPQITEQDGVPGKRVDAGR
ncbi:hypothetical protein I546_5304 [Mycobacterium kansasii 732]|nr:hypothetical protein I546_5304 [Mycobacterium kansasii 732]